MKKLQKRISFILVFMMVLTCIFEYDISIVNATSSSNAKNVQSVLVDTLEELQQVVLDEQDIDSTAKQVAENNVYSTKTLIVKTKKNKEIYFENATTIITGADGLYILMYDSVADTKSAYKELSRSKYVESVEVDSVVQVASNVATTNKNSTTNKKKSELGKFLETQDATAKVKVALIDTGVNLKDSSISERLISSSYNLSTSGKEGSVQDDNGHGTDMAKIIVENTDKNVSILPIKVANADGKATVLSVYQAINTAIKEKVDVINLSLVTVSTADTSLLETAINLATESGIIVVVSSGNQGSNTKYYVPTNVESAITVSATDVNGMFASYSNYGSEVDYSTVGVYEDKEGTSYAAAYVTAMVSILKSINTDYDSDDVKSILNMYATDLGKDGFDNYYGNGFISLFDIGQYDQLEEIDGITNADVTKTIFDTADWKTLSDTELNEIIDDSKQVDLAVWLQTLSNQELSYLLTKDTSLRDDYTTYEYEYDKNGNPVEETKDGSTYYPLIENVPVLYYEYLMGIDFTQMTVQEFDSKTGYYYLKINGADNTDSKIKINVTVSNSDNTKSQKATYSIGGTNNHSVKLTGSEVTKQGATTSKDEWDGKNTGTNDDGEFRYKTAAYNVFTIYASYKKPAYTYSVHDYSGKLCSCCRMNFRTYDWLGIESKTEYTLNAEGVNKSAVTEEFTMQINAHQMGLKENNKNKIVYSTIAIDLIYPTLEVSYTNTNGTSSGSNLATTTTKFTYDGSSKNKLVTLDSLGCVRTGYTARTGEEWKYGSTYFKQNTSYLATDVRDFTSGTQFKSLKATVNAQWTANTLTIKYDANGGTVSSTASADITTYSQSKNYASSDFDPANIGTFGLSKTGYHSKSGGQWNTKADGSGTSFDQDTSYAVTKYNSNISSKTGLTTTLYAQWEPNTYTVVYNANGGTGTMADQSFTYDVSQALRTNSFKRVGYKFTGWSTSATGSVKYSDKQTVSNLMTSNNSTRTLYAVWEPITYQVKYNANGGTGTMSNSTHTYDVSKNLTINSFIRRGFDFGGWLGQDKKNYSDQASVKNLSSTQDAIFNMTAQWNVKVLKITLDHQGGESNTSAFYEKYADNYYQESGTLNVIKSITIPERNHYVFVGYYTGKNGTGTQIIDADGKILSSNTYFDTDTTIYAHWNAVNYIDYDKNTDKTVTVPDRQVKEPNKAIQLTLGDMVVEDKIYDSLYRFIGWNDKADGTGNWYVAPYEYNTNKDLILYAQWESYINTSYIGNEQKEGEDFTDYYISEDTEYTFSDNHNEDGSKHYDKTVEVSYTDKETGETIYQEVESTLVGWSFEKGTSANDTVKIYEMDSSLSVYKLYSLALQNGAVTLGKANSDYGTYPKTVESRDGIINNSIVKLSSMQIIKLSKVLEEDTSEVAPYVNMYAVWDNGAKIEAYDLYYDLAFAQSTSETEGITLELLLSQATATDDEDGILAPGTNVSIGNGKTTTFTVSDYSITDFTSFTSSGSVTVNYQAIDSVGNITNKKITVHIVDNTSYADLEHKYTRFINSKYYANDSNNGGLEDNSIWRMNEEYKAVIESALSNMDNDSPVVSYSFSYEEIKEIKEFVSINGIGNLTSNENLNEFYQKFMTKE